MYVAGERAEDSQVASTGKRRSCSIFEELRVFLMVPGEERCGEALADMSVRMNAQSCWPQHEWTGDGNSPCLLASYLQHLNVEKKKKTGADAFSPHCFDPWLEEINLWSDFNVKRCENVFVCAHLDRSVQCPVW